MPREQFSRSPLNVPTGVILVWTGSITTIPDGWALCDGNNGTPDLRNRFARGVSDAATDPGSSGGQNSVSLTESQIPTHGHSLSSTNSVGNHSHTIPSASYLEGEDGGNDDTTGNDYETNISDAGSHSHSLNDSTVGSGSGIDNQPPHFEVAYIQKL